MALPAPPAPAEPFAVDVHVHIAGIGSGGTGCRLSGRILDSLPFRFYVFQQGLLGGRFRRADEVVRERLFAALDAAPSVRFAVVLALDAVHGTDGRPDEARTHLYVPNDYVLALARAHPKILAGVSIHPARRDAIEELERCAAAGASLVKWLPPAQGIDPADPAFVPFYDRMAALRMPLLSHTGRERTAVVVRADLEDPRRLALPLSRGVAVIAAHCGSRGGMWGPEPFTDFVALARGHENLFGDNSAMSSLLRGQYLSALLREADVLPRVLHGSDYPVPVTPLSYLGLLPPRAFAAALREKSPLERDVRMKLALGVPRECFTRALGILRIPAWKRPARSVPGVP